MKAPWKKQGETAPRRRQRSSDDAVRQRQEESAGSVLFRRNRTLVGSLSPDVSSASELTGDLRSPRTHVHHLNAHRRRLSTILLLVVSGILLLTWLLYEFTASIRISAPGTLTELQTARYQDAVNDYFDRHPFERLRFATNSEQLTQYLRQIVPEVESVSVEGSAGFASSQYEFHFRRPLASWLIGSEHYYVDQNGVSFTVNYFENPTVRIVDNSGVPQTTGTAVASSRFLRFVGRTVALSQSRGYTVEEAVIPPGSTRQVEIKVAGKAYPIRLSLDRPVGEQVEDMERAIAYFDTKGQTPHYIDVRVSGKAYYK